MGLAVTGELTERKIHRSVIEWMKQVRTADWFFFHVPNEGLRSPKTGKFFKLLGMVPGIPDLVIVFDAQAFFIELKKEGGKVTETQDDCHERLKRAGARVAVCRSIEDVRETFQTWRIPTRESA